MEALRPGDPGVVGRYRLSARLGQGGSGTVFLGRSPEGGRVAVRVIRPDLASDEKFRARLATATEAARKVRGPRVARVLDADPDGTPPWLVSEYVAGPTLQAVVAAHGPLPVDLVRHLGAGIALALASVHDAGVVHRDLKPANILLGPNGPRVSDVALARALSPAALEATGGLGSVPGLPAPEQVTGGSVTAASDVFMLGGVLCHALGVRPFGDGPSTSVAQRVVREQPALGEVPEELRDVVTKCLTKRPAGRPSAAEVAELLGGGEEFSPDRLPAGIRAMITEQAEAAAAALKGGSRNGTAGRSGGRPADTARDEAGSQAGSQAASDSGSQAGSRAGSGSGSGSGSGGGSDAVSRAGSGASGGSVSSGASDASGTSGGSGSTPPVAGGSSPRGTLPAPRSAGTGAAAGTNRRTDGKAGADADADAGTEAADAGAEAATQVVAKADAVTEAVARPAPAEPEAPTIVTGTAAGSPAEAAAESPAGAAAAAPTEVTSRPATPPAPERAPAADAAAATEVVPRPASRGEQPAGTGAGTGATGPGTTAEPEAATQVVPKPGAAPVSPAAPVVPQQLPRATPVESPAPLRSAPLPTADALPQQRQGGAYPSPPAGPVPATPPAPGADAPGGSRSASAIGWYAIIALLGLTASGLAVYRLLDSAWRDEQNVLFGLVLPGVALAAGVAGLVLLVVAIVRRDKA